MSTARPAVSGPRREENWAAPAISLLLWGLALTGRLDKSVLGLIGVRDLEVQALESLYADELLALRLLRAGGSLPLTELGFTLRGLLLEQLDRARLDQDQRALVAAARTMARMPLWVRDPELDALEREARRETALLRLDTARQRRAELRAQRAEAAAAEAGAAPLPPAPAAAAAPGLDAGSEPDSETAFSVSDMPPQVKSDAEDNLKMAFSVTDSAPEVKSAAAGEPASRPAQGRRKLPKAARKALAAAGRR